MEACFVTVPALKVVIASCLSGRRDVFMGLDTRRWKSCVCDPFWSFLLPPVFLSQVFCRVSVPHHRAQKQPSVMIVVLLFIPSRHNKTLTKKEKKMMTDYSDYIQDVVRNKKVGFLFKAVCLI